MARRRISAAALAALPAIILWLAGPAAQAQLSAWLDFEGAIIGEATDTEHQDWIEILGFNIGTGRAIATSGGSDREVSRPSLTELSLVKFVDRATPALFNAAVAGSTPFPKVTLDLNSGSGIPLARLELEDVLVSSQIFSATSGGEAKPVETISLNFIKITYIYILPNSKTLTASYDILKDMPTNPDSDSDGMLDSWESSNGLTVGIDDSGGDLDGDGLTNLEEYQLGTDPQSGTSFFKATFSADPVTAETYQLTWNSVPGKVYVIERSADLKTPFTALRTVTATATSTTESINPSGTVGFYRVRPQ